MIGTSAVGFIVTLVYDYMAIRYGLTAIGFVTFLVYFREYIKQAIDKAKAGN